MAHATGALVGKEPDSIRAALVIQPVGTGASSVGRCERMNGLKSALQPSGSSKLEYEENLPIWPELTVDRYSS